jgi:hypothetical protein
MTSSSPLSHFTSSTYSEGGFGSLIIPTSHKEYVQRGLPSYSTILLLLKYRSRRRVPLGRPWISQIALYKLCSRNHLPKYPLTPVIASCRHAGKLGQHAREIERPATANNIRAISDKDGTRYCSETVRLRQSPSVISPFAFALLCHYRQPSIAFPEAQLCFVFW